MEIVYNNNGTSKYPKVKITSEKIFVTYETGFPQFIGICEPEMVTAFIDNINKVVSKNPPKRVLRGKILVKDTEFGRCLTLALYRQTATKSVLVCKLNEVDLSDYEKYDWSTMPEVPKPQPKKEIERLPVNFLHEYDSWHFGYVESIQKVRKTDEQGKHVCLITFSNEAPAGEFIVSDIKRVYFEFIKNYDLKTRGQFSSLLNRILAEQRMTHESYIEEILEAFESSMVNIS